jgi:hypothetical protein
VSSRQNNKSGAKLLCETEFGGGWEEEAMEREVKSRGEHMTPWRSQSYFKIRKSDVQLLFLFFLIRALLRYSSHTVSKAHFV